MERCAEVGEGGPHALRVGRGGPYPNIQIARGARNAMGRHCVRADHEDSAPASDSADNISTKSRFIVEALLECPRLQGELPDHAQALCRARAAQPGVRSRFSHPQLPNREVGAIHANCNLIALGELGAASG